MFTSYATIAEKIFPLVYFQGEFFFVVYFSSLKPLVVFFFIESVARQKSARHRLAIFSVVMRFA
jgi:hypothetical protein